MAEGRERVKANVMTPQPNAESSRPANGCQKHFKKGKKISCEKRDQLRVEGKYSTANNWVTYGRVVSS